MSRQTQRAVTQDAVKAIQDSNSERAQEEWARKDEEAELTTGDGHEDEAMHTLLPPSRTGEEKGKLRSAGKKKEPNAIPLRIGESGLRRKRRASSVARMSGTSVWNPKVIVALFIAVPIFGLLCTGYYYISGSPPSSGRHHMTTPSGLDFDMADEGEDWSHLIGEDKHPPTMSHAGMKSNGTHWFNDTVIMVSFDGVRADYLDRGLTPNLLGLAKKGLRAEYLEPIFPSLTFPNHWTMQTGLYAESHGIVSNDFWDPNRIMEFSHSHEHSRHLWDTEWWLGEPMWSTAVKNGLKAAVSMWPGPPQMADKTRPTYFAPFQNEIHWHTKRDQIANWLDMSDDRRPQLIMSYLPEVDQEGHRTGPDSQAVREYLTYIDDFAQDLYDLLAERHLTDLVDVIFVSDHGMASTSDDRVIYLEDVLSEAGVAQIAHKEGWPSVGLRFEGTEDGISEDELVRKMREGAASSKGAYSYYDKSTMPKEWHFTESPRIAEHWLIPSLGWMFTSRQEHLVEMGGKYNPIGVHGYNNSEPDMRAFFVGHGPFAERIKQTDPRRSSPSGTHTIPAFSNIELYNLVTDKLLHLEKKASNNGTEGFWDQYLY